MKFKYFIGYTGIKEFTKPHIGNTVIERDEPIQSQEDVDQIQQSLAKENHYDVVIINSLTHLSALS